MTETSATTGIPTELITFGHLEIAYDARVLAPRPWTQAQSLWAARLLTELPPGDVLELCSGAGHIGLLGVAGSDRHLVQVDADEVACGFARANAARATAAGLGATVEVRHGLLEESLGDEERFALVIADPPWVPEAETVLHPGDPLPAIDGGADGLDAIRSCLAVIGRHLLPDGAAVLQVGDVAQAERVEAYVDARPGLGLRAVDHRVLTGGTLVHLARLAAGGTG